MIPLPRLQAWFTPMNRPGPDIVVQGGGLILGSDVLAYPYQARRATYCHELLSLCHVLRRRAAVRSGGNRPAR
jgi:hypothetical protein